MKVPFTSNEYQRLILRILRETGQIRYSMLERILSAINAADSDFDKFVKVVGGRYYDNNYVTLTQKPKLSELERTIEGLIFVGLIQQKTHDPDPGQRFFYSEKLTANDLKLTDEGARVAQCIKDERRLILRPRPPRRTTVFIACAFGRDDIDKLFSNQLAPSCTSLGYEPIKADMGEPEQSITESIIEGIAESACAIADLTYARPSVYFEVGLAHGLGVPLLLTCRSDHHRATKDDLKVHFDLEQYKISFWSRTNKRKFRWPKQMKPVDRLSKLIPSLSQHKD